MMFDKTKTLYGLIAIIVFQLLVLILEYGNAVLPLITGEEIRIKVIPVDPRSMFRGNYACLNYEIRQLILSNNSRDPRMNEIIYVRLKQNENGLYEDEDASLTKPESGIFIRGRSQTTRMGETTVRYGIEAFFAPKEKALELERKLRAGGIAVVMIYKNGKPALKDVVAE